MKRTPKGQGSVATPVLSMLRDNGIRLTGSGLWFQRGNTKAPWPLARWGAEAERNGHTVQLYSFRPMSDCIDGLIVAERGTNEFEVIPKKTTVKPLKITHHRRYPLPQKAERTIPVTVTGEAEEDLKKIIERTGIRQSDILRYINIAALRALAKQDYVAFPIELEVQNGKKK